MVSLPSPPPAAISRGCRDRDPAQGWHSGSGGWATHSGSPAVFLGWLLTQGRDSQVSPSRGHMVHETIVQCWWRQEAAKCCGQKRDQGQVYVGIGEASVRR